MVIESIRLKSVPVFILFVVMGCNPRPTLVSLNDQMARSNKLLNNAGTRFYIAANLALKNPGNVSDVESALGEVKSTLKSVKAEWEFQKLPKHPSKAAPAFLEAYQQYLVAEEAMISNNMEKILATLKDGAMDPAMKQQVVSDEFRQMSQDENQAFSSVTTTQSKFNSEHSFQAETKK